MRVIFALIILGFFCLNLVNCKIGEENGEGEEGGDNPIPFISNISPTSAVSHMPNLTITVNGGNFVLDSKIVFNGVEQPTDYINNTQLSSQIDPVDTLFSSNSNSAAAKGDGLSTTQDQTISLLVRNPTPGGGDSETLNFTIYNNHTFSPALNISNSPGSSGLPDIAYDSYGNIFTVWEDDSLGNYNIYMSSSGTYGQSWNPPVNISPIAGHSRSPAIAVNNSNHLIVVWGQLTFNQGLYCSISTDSGISWSNPKQIYNPFSGDCIYPDIAIDDENNIFVLWNYVGSNIDDIYFSRSIDNGNTWTMPFNVSSTTNESWVPKIATNGNGNLFIVWWDLSAGEEIFYRYSSDYGNSWSYPVNISNTPWGGSTHPQIAVDINDELHIIWDDDSPHPEELIYFTTSSDFGSSWSSPSYISLYAPYDDGTAMGLDSAVNINVTWTSHVNGKGELFYSRSYNNGDSWTAPMNISNIDPSVTPYQAMAVDNLGNVSVVWEAYDQEIYFTTTH